ncbi:MAG: HEAT repeat domain-containing protein, partial [Planctomycetota bacterium]
MLKTGTPEQQVAAAQVLAWLRPRLAAVVKALAEAAHEGDGFLRLYAVDALGAIGSSSALAALIPILHQEGALRNRVVRVMTVIGDPAEGILVKEFAQADPATRAVILEILVMTRGKAGMGLIMKVLKDPQEHELAEQVVQFLKAEADGLAGGDAQAEASRAKLCASIKEGLKGPSRKLPDYCKINLLEVLGKVADKSTRAVFMRYSEPNHSPEVRSAALRGLAGMEFTPAQTQKLLGYLSGGDFLHVVGPTLELLGDLVPSGSKMAGVLTRLLDNPRPEVRFFALKGLGHYPTAAVAKQLLPFLESSDPRVLTLASRSLQGNLEAREGVVSRFLAGRDLEEVGRLAEALTALAESLSPGQLKKLADRFILARERLAVLSSAKSELVTPLLLQEAKRLRQQYRFQDSIRVLMTISGAGENRFDPDARYELALTTLLMRDTHPASSEGDSVIGHFCHLLKQGYNLFERIRREKMLGTDDMLYLGNRFVERLNEEKRFGSDLLNYLIKR